MDHGRLQPRLILLALIMLFLAGCDSPAAIPTEQPAQSVPTNTPRFRLTLEPTATPASQPTPRSIRHPRPTLSVDTDVFAEVGCSPGLSMFRGRPCTDDGPISELGCEELWTSDLYGGLDPRYPLAFCSGPWWEFDGLMRCHGGESSYKCYRPIIFKDGAFALVSTVDEMRTLFAPIESADEALSYALLVTEYTAEYKGCWVGCGRWGPEDFHIYTDVIEDTHVVEVEDGYQVYLFDIQIYGCTTLPVVSVPVQVGYDGTISELPKVTLFEAIFEICVD